MAQKHNVIEINGRRYDASTGVPLDAGKTDHKAALTNASPVVTVPVRFVNSTNTTSHHPKTPANRSRAKNLKSHTPQPAQTLMRRAVSKPKLATRAVRLKAAGQLDSPPKGVPVIVKPSVSRLDAARLHHANHIKRSHLITRFNRQQMLGGANFITAETSVMVSAVPTTPKPQPSKKTGHRPRTTADVLEMALQNATSHLQPPVKPAKRHRVWHRRHAAAH